MMVNKIDQLIESLGISAYRFAEETGITRTTIYLLKNNPNQFPSGEICDRIIKTYGVSVLDIVEWREENVSV